jgi:hypothetical protein
MEGSVVKRRHGDAAELQQAGVAGAVAPAATLLLEIEVARRLLLEPEPVVLGRLL